VSGGARFYAFGRRLILDVRHIRPPQPSRSRLVYFALAVSGSHYGLISCYLRSAILRKGRARELEAAAGMTAVKP